MEPMLAWGLILLAAALLLVVLELFIPSAGLISITAGLIGVVGIVCLFQYDTWWGVAGILISLILVPMIFTFGIKIMPSTPLGKRLLFGESGKHEPVIPDELATRFDALMGAEGEALTDLRPIGTARLNGQRFEVRSEIAYIPIGSRIRVSGVEGSQIRVRPA